MSAAGLTLDEDFRLFGIRPVGLLALLDQWTQLVMNSAY
jgi:hypothetical protein